MKSKERKLAPGEIRILKALEKGPQRNKEIGELSGFSHQPTLLSDYLKHLQSLGLIERNIETRKFERKPIGLESMFLSDISEFLNEQFSKQLHEKDKNKLGLSYYFRWLIVTDSPILRKLIDDDFSKGSPFIEVEERIMNIWEKFVLSERGPKEHEIILRYRKLLLEAYNLVCRQEQKEVETARLNQVALVARFSLKKEFPEQGEPTDQAVYYEAMRHLKKLKEAENSIFQPWDLEDLFRSIKISLTNPLRYSEDSENFDEKIDNIEKKLGEAGEKQLNQIMDFLEDKNNKKIYEGYLKSVVAEPKTLLIYPGFGFRDYQKKMETLFAVRESS